MMRRVQTWLSGLFLVACAMAGSLGAQQRGVTHAGVDSLRKAVGFRVRVRDVTSPSWQTGTLGSVNDETLILRGREDEKIPTQSLVAAQRSMGRARFNPTFVGFVVGMLAGGGAGYAIGNANIPSGQAHGGQQRSVGLVLGAAVGGGIGAVVGSLLAPEHWREIKLR